MARVNYGFPYMGSKSKIADNIISILPPAENFYDLFSGGGAIVHCALLSDKYKYIYANDIQNTMSLFVDAVNGKYKNENRWISREQFHKEKYTDHYIRWVWSFGNNGIDYLYSPSNEQIKQQAHNYLFENGYDYTTTMRIKLIKEFNTFKNTQIVLLQHLQQLERLIHLERLERLLYLKECNISKLTISEVDYRDIEIKSNSVVYCDIPYYHKPESDRKYYKVNFNKNVFYEWAKQVDYPVFFSSSFCEDSYFEEVWCKTKDCLMDKKNLGDKRKITERLYWNKV